MTITEVLADSDLNETDKTKKATLIKTQCNLGECFFAFAQEADLGIKLYSDNNPTFLALRVTEKIKSNYQDTPNDSGHGVGD